MIKLPTTVVLVGLNVLVFLAMLAHQGGSGIGAFSVQTLLVYGADYLPLVKLGQWYRPLCSMFVHLNLIHLAMNMGALVQVGIPLERMYGRWKFVALYLVAGLVGAAVSLAYYSKEPVVSAGASGAITGLIGAAAVASHRAGAGGALHRNMLIRWLLFIFVYGALAKADNAAHLGGLVGGVLFALPFKADPGERGALPEARPLGLETVLLVALVGGTFGFALSKRDEAVSAEDLINQGVELANGGKPAEAIPLYRRAIAMDPKLGIAWYDLGIVLGETGDHDGAVDAYTKAIEVGGAEQAKQALVVEHVRYARRFVLDGKLDEAEKALGPALALDAQLPFALSVLGEVQTRKGQHEAAIATLRKGLSGAGDEDRPILRKQLASALVNHGVDLDRAGRTSETVALYREATELAPDDDTAFYDLGLSLVDAEDWRGAKAALERANALKPRRAAYVQLAHVNRMLGDEGAAKAMADEAEKLPKEE